MNRRELTADEVNNGTTVELAYRSSVVGSHEAVLEISGGGLKSPIIVNLKGQAIDDFVALPAKDITKNSFVAVWTPKLEATDYELNVWYDDYSSSGSTTTTYTPEIPAYSPLLFEIYIEPKE